MTKSPRRNRDMCVSFTSAVSAVGDGYEPLWSAATGAGPPTEAAAAGSGWPDLPVRPIVGFDVRERLGRKGTRTVDRGAALALAAVDGVQAQAVLAGRMLGGESVGLVLGTTAGSLASTIDFTVDGLTGQRPYLVDPARFPNTVMNFAAGQCAIRFALRGPNATVATGRIAGLQAVRYARRLLRSGQAKTVLAGGTEELTAHRAWVEAAAGTPGPWGEGAAMAVLEYREESGRDCPAVVIDDVVSGFAGPGEGPEVLRGLIAGLSHSSQAPIDAVFPSAVGGESSLEAQAALGTPATRNARLVAVADVLGDTGAASVALQLGTAVHWLAATGSGRALVTVVDPEGHVGALVVSSGTDA